jgi:hypothetical protein
MWGTNDALTSATFGTYTVELSTNNTQALGTGAGTRGFMAKLPGGRIDNTDASIRDFFRDYYFNRSTANGEGISLRLTGLTPNLPYNLTLVSFDADASNTVATAINWGPKSGTNTTGTSATINMLREPVPTALTSYSGTVQVSTTTGTLDIFGTSSAGSRGTMLNGFTLNDGTNDVLLVDIGEGASASVVPGFSHFSGPYGDNNPFTGTGATPTDSASQAFGAYTVSVERVGGVVGDTGFYNEYSQRMGNFFPPEATHAMFRDCFYNVSISPGDGVKLTIDGVTPNTEYDLIIWDMDPATSIATPTTWTPTGETTGPTGNVVNIRTPVPATINDPAHFTKIRVKTTSNKLEIFGTTTDGFGGVRLNAFQLNAVVAGDFDGDGDVDGADFVAWQTNFPKASGAVLAEGDADGDGDVDGADFVIWQTSFPFTPGPGTSSIPEPYAMVLIMLALPAALVMVRRGRSKCPRPNEL